MVQGVAEYPGVNQVRTCRYTRNIGVFPSVAIMEIVPQTGGILADGDLVFRFGGSEVRIRNAHVDYGSMTYSASGQVVSLRIFDRRWKWRFGEAFRVFNERLDDGTIDTNTEATPQQMASYLLDRMGETGYDVSALPNIDRPEVNWDGHNPAVELSKLCKSRGCEVALGLDDVVRIVVLGVGSSLPSNEIRTVSFGLDAPEKPFAIKAYGSKVLLQSRLVLHAVYSDAAGNLTVIDPFQPPAAVKSDVSAAIGVPVDEHTFPSAPAEDREAIEKTLFRWYIVQKIHEVPWSFNVNEPGKGIVNYSVDKVSQILPINNFINETFKDTDTIKRRRRAYCTGQFHNPTDPIPVSDLVSDVDDQVPFDFSLDGDRGLLKFDRPVYRLVNGDFLPARIYLTASYHGRHPDLKYQVRVEETRVLGGVQTPTEVIMRDDVQLLVTAEYLANSFTTTNDNSTQVSSELNAHIDARIAKYSAIQMLTSEYRGIQQIGLDGAIRQVTWEVSRKKGARTWAALNNEFEIGVLKAPQRRTIEQDIVSDRDESVSRKKEFRDGKGL